MWKQRVNIFSIIILFISTLFLCASCNKYGNLIPENNEKEDSTSTKKIEIVWGKKVTINKMPSSYGSQYGRLLHLENGKWLAAYTVSVNAGYKKDPNGGLRLQIAVSDDGGLHWKKISRIKDPGRDLDNAELVQLPNGDILLACRSVRWGESYRLPVYRSKDGGKSWEKISVIDSNEGKPGELSNPDKGMYEPHFIFLKDGRLAVMYANETHVTEDPSYSQIISEKISPDYGKTWGEEIWVASKPGSARPGMPVWTRMKSGKFIVTYEVCGPEEHCNIHYKISDDGVHWPAGLGKSIPYQNGAPFILSLNNGYLVITSNNTNISISTDYGETWHSTNRPWRLRKSYKEDWTQAIWPSLYQVAPHKIAVVTSRKRITGGHYILLRFGKIVKHD